MRSTVCDRLAVAEYAAVHGHVLGESQPVAGRVDRPRRRARWRPPGKLSVTWRPSATAENARRTTRQVSVARMPGHYSYFS